MLPQALLVLGSLQLIAKCRSILHNPVTYPNPEKYDPERWLKDGKLNPDVQDSAGAAFGFGRR
jgi:cytochrome P450